MSDSKVSVTISHRAPGIHPPLYVAGTFSNPEWVPFPMEYTSNEDGIHTFTKTFEAEPKSKIAYKYRVGEGDWWIVDETAPTVTDDAGNRNNVLEAPEAPIPKTQDIPVSEASNTAEATPPEAAASSEELAETPEKPIEKPVAIYEPLKGPIESKEDEQNETSTSHTPSVTGDGIQELKTLSTVDILKQSEQIGRQSTPEIAAEVADTAALLDCPTPEPEIPEETSGKIEEEQPATIMEKAAEADIAAEVADSAEKLDAYETEAPVETESSSVAHTQDTSEAAAEVADTASTLDVDEPEVQPVTAPPAYRTLAEVKADMKDDSLDIAGYSNDPEPVPLFAHECAGLYEDDEIPGAEEAAKADKTNGFDHERYTEDFDDPTLERFPSNKDEIISTVRKVETGLNADQTSVDGVPPSPIVKSQQSSVADVPSDRGEPDSPISARGQQSLSLPAPVSQQPLGERSLSASSLHSIAEDVEGDEAEKSKTENVSAIVERSQASKEPVEEVPKPARTPSIVRTALVAEEPDKVAKHEEAENEAEDVSPVVEPVQIADQPIEVANATGEEKENATAKQIAPAVEQPESANGLTEVAQDTEEQPAQQATTAEEVPAFVQVAPVAGQDHLPVVEQTNFVGQNLSREPDDQGLQKSRAGHIAPQVEKAKTADEVVQVAKEAEGEVTLTPHKPTLEPLITVPSPSTKPSTGLLSPISDDDEAVVLKNSKNKDKNPDSAARPGYLTPERATTPKLEEPGSPREPPPNTADPVAEYDLEKDVPEPSAASAPAEPRSPQIVVSRAEETQPEVELLPASSLDEIRDDETETLTVLKEENPKAVEATLNTQPSSVVKKTPEAGSHTQPATSSSALDERQTGSLKQRSVAKPNPADRTDTPTSITDDHIEAAKSGNWLSAFFRLIFIDLVGGLVSRICGGRRKTLVTTVVVLAGVGFATYRRASRATTLAE